MPHKAGKKPMSKERAKKQKAAIYTNESLIDKVNKAVVGHSQPSSAPQQPQQPQQPGSSENGVGGLLSKISTKILGQKPQPQANVPDLATKVRTLQQSMATRTQDLSDVEDLLTGLEKEPDLMQALQAEDTQSSPFAGSRRAHGVAVIDDRHGIWTGTFIDTTSAAGIQMCWEEAVKLSGEAKEQLEAQGARVVPVRLEPLG